MGYIRYITFQTTEQRVVVVEDQTIMKNINSFNRFSRLVFGLVTIELAVFWQAGTCAVCGLRGMCNIGVDRSHSFLPNITFSPLS